MGSFLSASSASLSQLNCYKPSGTVPLFGAAAALVISAAVGLLLGPVYAFVNHHDPLIYLNALLAIGLGKALGKVAAQCVRAFRIRSRTAALLIALAAFSAAYLAHWPAYVATVIVDYSEEFSSYDVSSVAQIAMELAKEPGETWEIIRGFNEEGLWSISGSSGSGGAPVSGIFLTLIWLAEAAVICYEAVTQPWKAAGSPYSERQERWLEPRTLPGRIAFVEQETEDALLRGDYSALSTPLPLFSSADSSAGEALNPKYATVTLYDDPFEPYVTVTNVLKGGANESSGLGKKIFRWLAGTPGKEEARDVVQYLSVSPTVAQNISAALASGAA